MPHEAYLVLLVFIGGVASGVMLMAGVISFCDWRRECRTVKLGIARLNQRDRELGGGS